MSIFTRLQPALFALSILAPGTPSGQFAWADAQRPAGCSESPVATSAPPNVRSKLFHHLRYHQSFPIHRAALLERAQESGEIDAAELTWIRVHLTAPRYESAPEVFRSLFPDADAGVLGRLEPASGSSPSGPALAQLETGACR